MLSITNLKVKYGNTEALHGISFTVHAGEIVTLIGANGAGKTTTLLSIARLGPPEGPKIIEGDITYVLITRQNITDCKAVSQVVQLTEYMILDANHAK